HQVQRRLVEHAASAGIDHPAGRTDHRTQHPVAAAVHGVGVHADIRRHRDLSSASRDPGAAGAEPTRSALAQGRRRMTHAPFIIAAYAIALLTPLTLTILAFTRRAAGFCWFQR